MGLWVMYVGFMELSSWGLEMTARSRSRSRKAHTAAAAKRIRRRPTAAARIRRRPTAAGRQKGARLPRAAEPRGRAAPRRFLDLGGHAKSVEEVGYASKEVMLLWVEDLLSRRMNRSAYAPHRRGLCGGVRRVARTVRRGDGTVYGRVVVAGGCDGHRPERVERG